MAYAVSVASNEDFKYEKNKSILRPAHRRKI